jgi:hypothetical protein
MPVVWATCRLPLLVQLLLWFSDYVDLPDEEWLKRMTPRLKDARDFDTTFSGLLVDFFLQYLTQTCGHYALLPFLERED